MMYVWHYYTILITISVASQENLFPGPLDTIACGSSRPRIFTDRNGVFTSPNHPGPYPKNSTCHWRITTEINETILLAFSSFSLEECGSIDPCNCDSVSIYDSNFNDPSKLMDEVCGPNNPGNFTSQGNNMFIAFKSDGNNEYSGFHAKYTADSACDNSQKPRILTKFSGEISSPFHPYNYTENLHCQWRFEAPTNYRVVLNFRRFDIERCSSAKCPCDSLTFYDGPNNSFPVLYKLCGSQTQLTIEFVTNVIFMEFVTDYTNSYEGFRTNYTFIPAPTTVPTTPMIRTTAPVSTTQTTSTEITSAPPSSNPSQPTTEITSAPTTSNPSQSTTAPIIIAPDIEVTLNGSFVSEGSANISSQCSDSYANAMNSRLQNMAAAINFLIGQQICAGTDLFLDTSDSRWLKNPDNISGSMKLSVTMPGLEPLSFFQHHQCAEEVSAFLQNHDNWGSPILDQIPGCPLLLFQPEYFSSFNKLWKC